MSSLLPLNPVQLNPQLDVISSSRQLQLPTDHAVGLGIYYEESRKSSESSSQTYPNSISTNSSIASSDLVSNAPNLGFPGTCQSCRMAAVLYTPCLLHPHTSQQYVAASRESVNAYYPPIDEHANVHQEHAQPQNSIQNFRTRGDEPYSTNPQSAVYDPVYAAFSDFDPIGNSTRSTEPLTAYLLELAFSSSGGQCVTSQLGTR